jgi:hypothetical protein
VSTFRFGAGFIGALALAACSAQPLAPQEPSESESPAAPTAPSPPTGPQPNFIITRGMNVVAEGGRTELSTIAFTRINEPNAYVLGLKQSEEVSSVTALKAINPVVARAWGTAVFGRKPGATAIRALYYGREYDLPLVVVSPTELAETLAGTWRGVGVRYCTDLVGNTRSCYPNPIDGQPRLSNISVVLTLSSGSGVLTGSIEMGGSGGYTLLTGPAFGGVDEDGRLIIGGFVGESGHGYHAQLRDWRFELSGTQLTGTGTTDAGFVNIYGPVLHRVTFTSITLTRQ